jgi:hypothetical protein
MIINGHEIAGRMPLFIKDLRQGIRDRRKKQTRRIEKLCKVPAGHELVHMTKSLGYPASEGFDGFGFQDPAKEWDPIYFQPRCKVGDIRVMTEPLKWVGESLYADDNERVFTNRVIAGIESGAPLEWRWQKDYLTSVHMPHEAARTLCRITGVRVERLQEISDDDCIDEGTDGSETHQEWTPATWFADQGTPTMCFAALWDSINADRGYSWESNPYVFVYSFEVV